MAKKEYLWSIGAAIYVLGMFPLFYLYQFQHDTSYGLIDFFATTGAFIVMFGMGFGALWPEKNESKKPA